MVDRDRFADSTFSEVVLLDLISGVATLGDCAVGFVFVCVNDPSSSFLGVGESPPGKGVAVMPLLFFLVLRWVSPSAVVELCAGETTLSLLLLILRGLFISEVVI